jgi:glycerophosphoryl diester phosphodiesterase
MKKLVIALCLLQAVNTYGQKVMVAAHRGDWRNYPENSVRAFLSAAEIGVDIVELDLNKTKDGEVVIMHDGTINRTTDGKGKPSDYTLEELKKFHLRDGIGRVSRNTIPTLREVMLALKNTRVKVNLDKSFPYYREAYAVLKETGTLNKAIFKSTLPFDSLKAHYPDLIDSITYMAVVDLDQPGAKGVIEDYLKNMHPYAFELCFAKDTSDVLYHNEFIRKAGAKIWMNSLWASLNAGHDDDTAVEDDNKKDSWDWLIAHGAVILQTDRSKLMLEYLKKKGLR